MAACQLTIKLDDSNPRTGGEPISGTVIVRTEKEVSCKALVVSTIWSTHGRGNVEIGEVANATLFEGTWKPGQEYSYAFKLATAKWPPTYYGTYLNLAHYVSAQAKIPWSVDPRVQSEYLVTASDAPDDLQPTKAAPNPQGMVARLVIPLIVGTLLIGFAMAFIPLLIFLAVVAAPIALIVWFVKVVLPKRITGPVTCEVKTPKVKAGGVVEANLTFTPARRTSINGITWKIRCIEECVSGSGSNRKTHVNELLSETQTAVGVLELKPGEKQSHDFRYQLPDSAAPSLKFTDNHIKWTIDSRIDIPSWPDWTKTLSLIVSPNALMALGKKNFDDEQLWDDEDEEDDEEVSGAIPPVVAPGTQNQQAPADDAWLRQVITQIHQSQHDDQQLAMVLAAVRDFVFPIQVSIVNEMDTPEFTDENEFDSWDEFHWWGAYCPAQNSDMALAWEVTPKQVKAGAIWSGTASIIGFEAENKRLLMAVIA
ncbi:MAG: hypothetical protein IT423_05075 [Pirellulaceae bacterium]|nr:hypothetical protein [Pirellulaceae bacterium]